MEILTREYVYANGKDMEDLGYDPLCACVTNLHTDLPYNGLAYSNYNDSQLEMYCFYKNGQKHGECVEFHYNGNVKSCVVENMGLADGIHEEWDEEGNLVLWEEIQAGICLRYKKWDSLGNLIEEKKESLESQMELIKSIEKGWCKQI